MTTPLVDLFLEAVAIDAVSLHEAPVVRFIREKLSGLPVRIVQDGTGPVAGGETGNIFCIPSTFDPARPAVALLAHMDTPRSTANVRPVLSESRISSDGTTTLGVDNRAGVSVLLHVLSEHVRKGLSGNFIVVFTFGEEIGRRIARGTVGLRLGIDRFICKVKMSQDKDPLSRAGVLGELAGDGPYADHALAAEMARALEAPDA